MRHTDLLLADALATARDSHLGMFRAPYVVHGGKYIDLVSHTDLLLADALLLPEPSCLRTRFYLRLQHFLRLGVRMQMGQCHGEHHERRSVRAAGGNL